MKTIGLILSALTVSWFAATVTAQTSPHAENLKNYLTDDIAAVFYLDLSKIELQETVKTLSELDLLKQEEIEDIQGWVAQIEEELRQLQAASITSIYGLIRMEDFLLHGPHWVIPIENPQQIPVALERLQGLKYLIDTNFIETWNDDGRSILAGGKAVWLENIKTQPATGNRQLDTAWQTIGGGSAGVLVMGDADSRNVTRFMLPKFPAPFENITGKLVADKIKWAGLELNIGTKFGFKVIAETNRPEVAGELKNAAIAGVQLLFSLMPQQENIPVEAFKITAELLKPNVAENMLSICFDSTSPKIEQLVKVIQPATDQIRSAAIKVSETNRLRQLALAFHNYESAFRCFPIPHKNSEKKFSNFSWRVHILPFLEQGELHNQFNFDEPWDSEHNRRLIDKMPEIYKSDYPEYRAANLEGRTPFLVPHALGAISDPHLDKPRTFGDFKDGTSNTILLVTVAAEHAQIWTQPADWELDYASPLQKLHGGGRTFSLFARVDASVGMLPLALTAETLSALVTIAGGEVADIPKN